MSEQQPEEKSYPRVQSATFAGGTLLTAGVIDLIGHLGPTGLFVGGLASYVAWRHGPEVYELVRDLFPSPPAQETQDASQDAETTPRRSGRSLLDRAIGRFPDEVQETPEDEGWGRESEENDLPTPASTLSGTMEGAFLFSSVLSQFTPTLERVYLARTIEGSPLYCRAKDLCHVALAGSTGNGKSAIMRLLMVQLCKAGAQVLLLNPHYTRYDLESGEDWTPFEPYLVYDPMQCKDYGVIEHYLKHAAQVLLPKRLEKRALSQPLGKPYFLVIDELPSIVRHVKKAPEYMRELLEEGRKVGIFLITAAQDFLVRTIAPGAGGGSLRECYRTAYYVGGDGTTARLLLDMEAGKVPENELGKGSVMLRCASTSTVKKAALVRVLLVDNAALYRLLGPSTYQRVNSERKDAQREALHHSDTASAVQEVPMDVRKVIFTMREARFLDQEIMRLTGLSERDYRRVLAQVPLTQVHTPSQEQASDTSRPHEQRERTPDEEKAPEVAEQGLLIPTPMLQEKGPRAEDIDLAVAIDLWNKGYNSDRRLAKVFRITLYQANRLSKMIEEQAKKRAENAAND